MSDTESLARRVEKLEQQNRLFKRTGGLIVAILGAAMLLGQAKSEKTASSGPKSRVVEAERFVLKDKDGKTRGEWLVGSEAETGLKLYDADGKVRAFLCAYHSNTALFLHSRDNTTGIGLIALPESAAFTTGVKGGPNAQLWVRPGSGDLSFTRARTQLEESLWQARAAAIGNGDGLPLGRAEELLGTVPKEPEPGLRLGVTQGVPYVSLRDKDGKRHGEWSVDADGATGLRLFHKDEKLRGAWVVDADGEVFLWLFDKDEKLRGQWSAHADGGVALRLFDKDEKPRASLGQTGTMVTKTGTEIWTAESSLVLFDKEGKVIYRAPLRE